MGQKKTEPKLFQLKAFPRNDKEPSRISVITAENPTQAWEIFKRLGLYSDEMEFAFMDEVLSITLKPRTDLVK
jgi:hypothetical protein